MMYSSWDTEWNRQNFLSFWIIFCLFIPLMILKIRILKKKMKKWGIILLYIHVYHKVRQTKFLSFWTLFCPFSPLTTWKIKILKLKVNTWRYYHFTHLHHKWQSYDVLFLSYGARQTKVFVILDRFLLFYTPMNPENQNFEKTENHLKILSFYKCVP